MKTKILIWGAGQRTKNFIENGLLKDCEIIAIVDSFNKHQSYFDHHVIQPNQISDYFDKIDFIVICSQFYAEILGKIKELKIPLDKVIITDQSLDDPVYRECYERARDILPDFYEQTKNIILKTVRLNERDHSDKTTIFNDRRFNYGAWYYYDYFRFRTFEFLAEEIVAAGIDGAVAELGVFNGTFAALINEKFLNRSLYLFDTFEGFDPLEAEAEKAKERCDDSFIMLHKNSSVETVLKNLPYPEKAIICKGFFPDSIIDEAREEKFAFVSLDVDFEESTYQGLEFFYPRLTERGYIMIHDYNTYFLDGVKKAVERYEQKLGVSLKKVPIADRAGTVVVVK